MMLSELIFPTVIPAPPISGFDIFGFQLHFYSLTMLVAILTGAIWAQRRFVSRGGDAEKFQNTIFVAVIFGIIGARAYHVLTDHQIYFGADAPKQPIDALKIWEGGLGIWGAIAAGGVAAWVMCRRQQINFPALADVVAVPLLPAHAIGRLGNYFNQELFGKPTDLPWALYVDPPYRPAGYEQFESFHPTFLYEGLWTTLGCFVLLWVERRFRLGRGKLFIGYVMWYCFGRFFVEALRIDPANHVGGFRINNYVSLIVFVIAAIWLAWALRNRPGYLMWPFGTPRPSGLRPAKPRVASSLPAAGAEENSPAEDSASTVNKAVKQSAEPADQALSKPADPA